MNLTKVGVLKEIEKLGNSVKNNSLYSALPPVLTQLRNCWKAIKNDEDIITELNKLRSFNLSAKESNHLTRIIFGVEGKLDQFKDEYVVNSSGSELITNHSFHKSQKYSARKDIFDFKQFKETD